MECDREKWSQTLRAVTYASRGRRVCALSVILRFSSLLSCHAEERGKKQERGNPIIDKRQREAWLPPEPPLW